VKCRVRASDGNGIEVLASSNVRLRDNRIEDVTGIGIHLEADHSAVLGNRIDVGDRGVTVFGDLNVVEENLVESAATAGISIGAETFPTFSNLVADNVLGGGSLAGEGVIADTATGLVVIDNVMRAPDFAGVYLLECTDSVVLGNVIQDSGLSGIELDFGCVGVFARKNKITAAGANGIFLHNASDENVLRDNVVRMSFDVGVLLDDSNANLLVGNKATLNGGFDFEDQGADNVLIDNVFPNVAP
jgi:parallel beta-helix repeat protein